MSLARISIGHEWRRYLAAILVVSLTGVLFYLQAGLISAYWHSMSAFERELDADIIVYQKGGMFGPGILRAIEPESLYIHPNVTGVEALRRTRIADGGPDSPEPRLQTITVNTASDSMTFPRTLDVRAKALLDVPGTILLSRQVASQRELELGSTVTLAGVTLEIVGLFTAPFDDRANAIVSLQTVKAFYPQRARTHGSPYAALVRLADAGQLDRTIGELNSWLEPRGLRAIRPEDFAFDASMRLLRSNTLMQTVLLVGGFVILVAVIITAQTLKLAVTAFRQQFATLRAMGVTHWRIAAITMELAFWVGLLSATLSVTAAFLLQAVFSYLDLAMQISWAAIVYISCALLLVSLVAGVFCLRFAFKVDPSELLR